MTAQINDTPDVIYLCVGDGLADEGTVGFDELFDVTWCSDQQGPDDIKYVKADRIAILERELAEAKALEQRVRDDAARWSLLRGTPSGVFDRYKDEWRFRCNVFTGRWCKNIDETMDYALSRLRAPYALQQKGDTNG